MSSKKGLAILIGLIIFGGSSALIVYSLVNSDTWKPIMDYEDTTENLAYQHLENEFRKYFDAFYVYSDMNSAGNHFNLITEISSAIGYQEIVPDYTIEKEVGTCIKISFRTNSDGTNWAGAYFMQGVQVDNSSIPKQNWGNYDKTGWDLSNASKLIFFAKGDKGGEQVEFFCAGLGRNSQTGVPFEPFPDSSPKISLGYIKLTKDWKKYEIDLMNKNMSYTIGGFGFVAGAYQNGGANRTITYFIDNILYEIKRADIPHFLCSYVTLGTQTIFDITSTNVAYTYDNALAILAFLARGKASDINYARLIAEAFIYAIYHDRTFKDGRIRNAYQGGDLVNSVGNNTSTIDNLPSVRMPGWWNTSTKRWEENSYDVGSNIGPSAWVCISLISYYQITHDTRALAAALKLGEWIDTQTRDIRGYFAGYQGWEQTFYNSSGQTKLLHRSTEENIAVYVAFARLYDLTLNPIWKLGAINARTFVQSMWNEADGNIWTGVENDLVTINKKTVTLDSNMLFILSGLNRSLASRILSWARINFFTNDFWNGLQGFDFNTDKDAIWCEGTAQMSVAYQAIGDPSSGSDILELLERIQVSGKNGNGQGLIASNSESGISTGVSYTYYNRLSISATCWFIFANREYNPYWNLNVTTQVPDLTY